MNALTVFVIGAVAGWVGFLVGVLFVCVIETAHMGRARRSASCQPSCEREVSL